MPVRFAVRVQTRASRSEIVGALGELLKVRIAAAPVEDAANSELVALLAKRLGVPKSAVRIVKGARSRDKLVEVEDVSEAEVRQLFG